MKKLIKLTFFYSAATIILGIFWAATNFKLF